MIDLPPVRTRVFDKNRAYLFPLDGARSVSATVRHMGKGTGTVTVDLDHPRIDVLLAEGTRVTMDYFVGDTLEEYLDDSKWLRLINGPLLNVDANGPIGQGYVNLLIHDDFGILERALAWPVPTAAITAQTSEYDVRSGPAETVAKGYVAAAVTRLGLPVAVAADQGRGAAVSLSARFDSLADLLVDACDAAGIGFRFTQRADGVIEFDCYVPVDRTASVVATEASGTLLDWQVLRTAPSGTRAVVGGSGDGTARALATVSGTFGDEAAWGFPYEVFVEETSATTVALAQAAGATALETLTSEAGVSATLAETPVVRYGRTYQVGDILSVAPTPSLSVAERVSSCTVTWNTDDGLSVSPEVGNASDTQDPNATLAVAISGLMRAVRKMRSRR